MLMFFFSADFWRTISMTTAPSLPALPAIPRSGSSSARRSILTPVSTSPSALTLVKRGDRVDQRHAAARDDAFLDRGAGCAQRILDAVLLLLELGLGGGADFDDRNAAGELGQPLLQLLAIVVGGRGLDLGADLLDAALDRLLVAWPSMKVVSSLVATTRRARPRSSMPALSSLRPISSEMTWPPVRMAMSRSISLRRSPKPGALTASTLSVPRSLLTTRVASASPSTSSAMITNGRACRGDLLEHRQDVLRSRRPSCR